MLVRILNTHANIFKEIISLTIYIKNARTQFKKEVYIAGHSINGIKDVNILKYGP